MADDDPFAIELAGAVSARTGRAVRFEHGSDRLLVSGGRFEAHVRLANFRLMHVRGRSTAEIADGIAEAWRVGEAHEPLTRAEVERHAILHVTRPGEANGTLKDALSPFVDLALGLDHPSYVRFLFSRDLEAAGISEKDALAAAVRNLGRILAERPGEPLQLEDGLTVLAFGDDLAADRAHAHAVSAKRAAALFLANDLAIASDRTDPAALTQLMLFGAVMSKLRHLDHPLSPAVHLFAEGECKGAGVCAIKDERES